MYSCVRKRTQMQDMKKTENPFVLKKSHFTAKEVAETVGYSESLVKKVRSGEKDGDIDSVKKIKLADHLLYEGSNALLDAVKKIVKL